MKKVVVASIMMLGIGALVAFNMYASKMTNYGIDAGKKAEAQPIQVTNWTDGKIYVAVYEEAKGKNPELFGDVYLIEPGRTENVLRPEWTNLRRLNPNNNRNLYFGTAAQFSEFLPDLFVTNSLFSRKQFVNIGNQQGNDFTIYKVDNAGNPAFPGTKLQGAPTSPKLDQQLNALQQKALREGRI